MKPTAQDFLDAYNKHNLKPIVGQFNVCVQGGVFALAERGRKRGACCPMTAFMLGKPADESLMVGDNRSYEIDASDLMSRAFSVETGVATTFWAAFDRYAREPEAVPHDGSADYQQLAHETAKLLRDTIGIVLSKLPVR